MSGRERVQMNGDERRSKILHMLISSKKPISGGKLSEMMGVSRQIIVQDIALLRAGGNEIYSTSRGYLLAQDREVSRVFKVYHHDDRLREEMDLIVDLGGQIRDVFVYHKVYGMLRVELGIRSRRDVDRYMQMITSGQSAPLSRITNGYHYHTVLADSSEILDLVQKELEEHGFLAKLTDYEPVDFWSSSSDGTDPSVQK